MSAQSEEKPKKSEDQIRQEVRKHREFQAVVLALISIFIIGQFISIGILWYVVGAVVLQRVFFALNLMQYNTDLKRGGKQNSEPSTEAQGLTDTACGKEAKKFKDRRALVALAVIIVLIVLVGVAAFEPGSGPEVVSVPKEVTAQQYVAAELQKYTLPHSLNDELMIVDIHAAEQNEVVYEVKVVNLRSQDVDWGRLKAAEESIATELCATGALSGDLVFTYKYCDKLDQKIGQYSITSEDCI